MTIPSSADGARQAAPIRIVYLLVSLELGGTERQITDLALALDRTRFEPRVCCLTTGGPLERPLRERGVLVYVVGLPRPRGEAGRRRVAERFDLATMAHRHEALYERLGCAVPSR